jgi:hypothetical protein
LPGACHRPCCRLLRRLPLPPLQLLRPSGLG